MASLVSKKCFQVFLKGSQNRVVGLAAVINNKSPQINQVATIVSPANYNFKADKPAPWPYQQQTFTVIDQFYDSTEARLDENSKVIVVDGNLAVGKTNFAKKLADSLGFHLVPHISEADLFFSHYYQIDARWANHTLPAEHKIYDLRAWLTDPHPEKGIGAKLQMMFYRQRLFKYSKALHHLMSTGQGVIIERSPFSDQVFAEAMNACGFMSRPALKYYLEYKRQTIFDFWKPHLTIYLDAPVDFVVNKLKQRNHAAENGSKALTKQFVSEIDRAYKKSVLPDLKRHGEVLVYDATEMDEIDVVVEYIERLKLDWDPNDEKKFQQWHDNKAEDILSYFRRYWGSQIEIRKLFNLPLPWHIPEMMDSPESVHAMKTVFENHPRTAYHPEYNPNYWDKWSLLLKG